MASTCLRSATRASLFSLRSHLKPKAAPRPSSIPTGSASTGHAGAGSRRIPTISRLPAELGCCSGSLLPLHSTVAAARLTSCLSSTSRSCRALSQEIGVSVPR